MDNLQSTSKYHTHISSCYTTCTGRMIAAEQGYESGQYYSKFINMKFGSLLILDLIYDINKTGRSRYQFICQCDCGTIKNIPCWYIFGKKKIIKVLFVSSNCLFGSGS